MSGRTKVDVIYDIVKSNNKLLIEDIKQTTENKTNISNIKKILYMVIAPVFSIATIVSLIAAFAS